LVLLALAAHLLWNSHRFGVFYVLGQFGTLAVFIWLIRVGRAQEARLYSPYLNYAAPALMQTPSGRSSRKHRRSRARLAGAIGNGDVRRAHAAADALATAAAR